MNDTASEQQQPNCHQLQQQLCLPVWLRLTQIQDAAAAIDIQSIQAALASATSTNQGSTSDSMDVEGDIGSATNYGNDGTGNEGTARQKDEATSKAKGKGKEKGESKGTGQGGAGQGKESVQEMIDHIKGLVNQATLGYALMTVMDDNDLGTGPMMQCQQINLCGINKAFMADFLKGKNCKIIFQEAIRESEKQIRARGVWLVRFLDLDVIQSHEDRVLVESCVASNCVLPVHQDSKHDSMQLIMKILLDTSSPEAREKFIQQALKSIQSMNTSYLGKILRDCTLFNSVFNLFQFNHFCSLGGAMIYISDCCYKILHFLATLVEFNDVPTNTPPQDIKAWFASQYEAMSQEFEKPIQLAACQVLDKSYFKHWADMFAKYYWEVIICHAEMEKEGSLHVPRDPISDILRLTMPAKLKALQHGLIAKIHGNKFLSLFPIPTKLLPCTLGEQLKSIQPAIKEMVMWMEPFAAVGVDQRPPWWCDHLRALEHCIKTKLGVNGISRRTDQYSCPLRYTYKYLFHAHHDAFLGMNAYLEVAKNATDLQDLHQLSVGTFEGAIDSYIKDSWNQLLQSGLKSAEAPSMPQPPELASIDAIDSELETVQSEYVESLSQILCHTSFPWLEASKVKRSETLVKKLIPLFESYKAHHKLLGTGAAWRVREDLIDILSVLEKRGGRGTWSWYDLLVERPIKEVKDQLDKTQGPMPLDDHETEGNLYAYRLQLGFGGKALPEARKATDTSGRPESEEDLGGLYPVDLPDAMTEKETAMYIGKQEGSGLWFMEKNEEQAEKDRATTLEKEHQNVKVFQSAKIQRAYIVAERMRKRQLKSRKIVLESDEEESLDGVASTSKAQQAAGHDTEASGRSPVRPGLDIGATDMSQATTTYTWEAFKGVISQAKSDTQFQKLPAILFLLLIVLELAQDIPEARVGLDRVVKELGQATESPSAQVVLGCILSLKGVVGHQGVKYIKKAQDLVRAGTATVAPQWFE
ncbi:hypothetical protein EDD16DRAFT_1524611 [Pisolithus croceorrhizus]|nr:hypothetical protein EDD16DRAFT_1524611 [Pisolithus croceorrhizus]